MYDHTQMGVFYTGPRTLKVKFYKLFNILRSENELSKLILTISNYFPKILLPAFYKIIDFLEKLIM